MKVLVIGSGGREHALVRALQRDQHVTEVICAPGNAGIAADAHTVAVDMADPQAVADLADEVAADLVVIGPELPLVNGAADEIRRRGRLVFGPDRAAAQLEGSKSFAKEVMNAAGVPTAAAVTADSAPDAEAALDRFGAPYVVKADGLAAGKGVVVTDDRATALAHVDACLAMDSGCVVIEEYLDGPEVSLFVLCDGTTAVPLQPAQDFKRAYADDAGPNTGGMGAYSPLPWAPPDLAQQVVRTVAEPVLSEMARRGTPFVGLLYVGLALTSRGLRVVEFNVRFGDPETQAVLELLQTPLAGVLAAAASGTLSDIPELEWRDDAAVIVVLASAGYPASARVGDPIAGLPAANDVPGVAVLHAGTRTEGDQVVSAGGRVLGVVGTGESIAAARAAAYTAMAEITLADGHYRPDIAAKVDSE